MAHFVDQADKRQWRLASQSHPMGQGVGEGVGPTPAQSIMNDKNIDPALKGMVVKVAAAGLWTARRRHQQGYSSSPICTRCQGAEEDLHHMAWGCPGNARVADDDQTFATTEHLAQSANQSSPEDACLWVRGLMPEHRLPRRNEDEVRTETILIDNLEVVRGSRTLRIATDGSGGPGRHTARTRRCGWARVLFDSQTLTDLSFAKAGYGALEGSKQTVPRAELVAIIQGIKALPKGATVEVWSDHKNHVRRYSRGKDAQDLGDHEDLWEELWQIVDSHEGHITLHKVKGHAKAKHIYGSGTPGEVFVASYIADALADEAAKLSQLPLQELEAFRQDLEHNKRILLRIAKATLASISEQPQAKGENQPKADNSITMSEIGEQMKATTHHIVPGKAPRSLQCSRCGKQGMNTTKKMLAWLRTDCEGAARDIDPSHDIRVLDDTRWCGKCGCFSQCKRVLRGLGATCGGRPNNAYTKYMIGRFTRGKPPLRQRTGTRATEGLSWEDLEIVFEKMGTQ